MAGIGSLAPRSHGMNRTWATIAFDCPNPHALGVFYQNVTGWELQSDGEDDDWVILRSPVGGMNLAFQGVEKYVAPEWPSADRPQQAHLDLYVDDLDEGEAQVLSLGARKAELQPGKTFRVFLDPVGHPFCLCQS